MLSSCVQVLVIVNLKPKMEEKSLQIEQKLDSEMFSFDYCDDGILYIHIEGDEFNARHYKTLISKIGEITDGKKAPILCTADGPLYPDEETRKLMSAPDANPNALAVGAIAPSLTQKLVGNFVMKIVRPRRQIRIFTNREDAVIWLKSFLVIKKYPKSPRKSLSK